MFDISKFKFGLGSGLEYNINPYELFSQNAVVNQLEVPFAVMLPSNHTGAVIKGTFEDIITDITPA
jgi:hypothetical protein